MHFAKFYKNKTFKKIKNWNMVGFSCIEHGVLVRYEFSFWTQNQKKKGLWNMVSLVLKLLGQANNTLKEVGIE